MKVIKQRNAGDCLVATCMMITDEDYKTCAEAIWDGVSYSVTKMIKFCASKDILLGFGGIDLREVDEIPEEIVMPKEQLLETPAYVSVKSDLNQDFTHAVYWDEKMFCDPRTGTRRPLDTFEWEIWWPIVKLRDIFDYSTVDEANDLYKHVQQEHKKVCG